MLPLASDNPAHVVVLVQLGCSPVLAELGKEVCQTHAGSAPDIPSAIWPQLQNIRGELPALGHVHDGLGFAANGWPFARAAKGWLTNGWLALALALAPAVVRRIPAALHGHRQPFCCAVIFATSVSLPTTNPSAAALTEENNTAQWLVYHRQRLVINFAHGEVWCITANGW